MKKIASPIDLFSFPYPNQKPNKYKKYLPAFLSRLLACCVLLILFAFMPSLSVYSQQVLGAFPGMEGGFEAGTPVTLGNVTASYTVTSGTQLSNWSYAKTSQNTVNINTTTVRSGTKSLDWSTSSSSAIMVSPTAPNAAIVSTSTAGTSYVVQFYYWKNNTGSARNYDVSITADGTTYLGPIVATGVLGTNSTASTSWQKATAIVTTGLAATPRYGFVQLKGNGGSFTNFLIDDYCIYQGGAVDVTAPGNATAPTAMYISGNQLDLSWVAPAGGVDGGGYVVVRYPSDPAAEPAPNTNGIYSLGSSIGNGTVAYIGTGTSFSNTGLTASTLYYYRVYTVDKAFNYSPTPVTFVGMTVAPATPAVSLTIPGVVAASIEKNSVTDIIYSFSMTSTTYYTTLTQLTFANTSSTYTSADFANFKLYSSTTNSFPGGTPLATIAAPTNVNPQTFTGFSKIIPPSPSAIYFWITTDVKALAVTGNSITVTPDLAAGNLTFTGTTPTLSVTATASGAQTIIAPAQYTWNGGASGSWIVPTNWTPTRSTIKASDDIIFATAGAVTVTNLPATETVSSLLISNNGNITLTSAAASTLTILNISGLGLPDLTVSAGNTLNIGATVNVTLGTGTTADISGVLNVNTSGTYNTDAANAVTSVTNATYPLAVDGIISNNGGTITSTTAPRLVIKNGAVYNHNVNGGVIPTATWNTNSTCLISGSTSTQNINGHKQTFSKFVWDCPSQSHFFVLGENSSSSAPNMVVSDSLIIKRTNGQIFQLTSSGGQKDFICGNYFQYGGTTAVTYNTGATGQTRSLTVNNTFYVTDSLETPARFQIINNPGSLNSIIGKLFVKGNIDMHKQTSGGLSLLELKKDNLVNPSTAELWFSGSGPQQLVFSSISDSVDFVTNHTGPGVLLATNANASKFKLIQGTFFIGTNTLTIVDSVAYPGAGLGLIGGSSTSNLILGSRHIGTGLKFASGYQVLKDFTQLAGSIASLATELSITGGSAPGRDSLGIGASLTTNGNLILRSDINGTARMGRIPVDGSGVALATISGGVTVERFLPMDLTSDSRRWRLLTAPFKTTNAPNINAAWQESVSNSSRATPIDPKPGYGTQITKSVVYGSDGYDQGSTNNSSIYYYSNGLNGWVAPTATNAGKITDNSSCYMLFVRGDRSILIADRFVSAKPTTLEPKGELNTGNVTIGLASSGYQTVGNPYASQIKLDNIVFNDTLGNKKTIYLWDPKTLGSFSVGKFVTCSGDGGSPATYTYTGNTSLYNTKPGVIESSGAFMVKGNGGSVVFHEADKVFESNTIGMASRPSPSQPPAGSFGTIQKLFTDLLVIKDGQPSLADGVAVTFNRNYKNAIDYFDAPKLSTFTTKEDLSIVREAQLFAIERRKEVSANDTIFLNISKLGINEYQFGFRPLDFNGFFTVYLEDNFLHTSTEVSLLNNSTVSFSITADPASAENNRFHIVFKRNKAVPKSSAPNLVSVIPNPVTNGQIGLQMDEMPEGEYGVRLINSAGQVVYTGKIVHQNNGALETVDVKNIQSKGVYKLELISFNKSITAVNVVMQ